MRSRAGPSPILPTRSRLCRSSRRVVIEAKLIRPLAPDELPAPADIPPYLAAQFPNAVLQSGFSLYQSVSKYQIGFAILFPNLYLERLCRRGHRIS